MSGLFRQRTLKIVGTIILLVGTFAFLCWRVMQPKIQTASEAAVRAALPPELLVKLPFDAAANGRYKRLVDLSNGFNRRMSGNLSDPWLTDSARNEMAQRFWDANPHLLSELALALAAGPVQSSAYLMGDLHEMSDFSDLRSLSKLLATSAQSFAKIGNFNTSVEMLGLGVELGDRVRGSGGTLIDYLVADAIDQITSKAIVDTIATSGFPVSGCKILLSKISPSPYLDDDLAATFRGDFQRIALKMLPDVTKPLETAFTSTKHEEDREPIVGTYDALETTRLIGEALRVALLNVRRPFSQFDPSERRIIEREIKELPGEVDAERPDGFSKSWDKFKYRFLMDNTRNSLGRKLLSNDTSLDPVLVEISDRWRAYRDVIRVYLASRIYRAAHGGQLPASISGFVPILGSWPTDPFNGKPMIYLREKEVVYSVGKNLIDDGGQVGGVRGSKDLGISLK